MYNFYNKKECFVEKIKIYIIKTTKKINNMYTPGRVGSRTPKTRIQLDLIFDPLPFKKSDRTR